MPSVKEVYHTYLKEAAKYEIEGSDVRYLMMVAEHFASPADVILFGENPMKNYELFKEWFEQRKRGRPVQYITNYASFLMEDLYVDERVLIPRPETEYLVSMFSEKVRDIFDPRNLLMVADIGTGSGAILKSLSHLFPKWVLYGSDISYPALEVAAKNLEHNRVTLLYGDALEPYIAQGLHLDIIIANPPYVMGEEAADPIVRDNEPAKALYFDENNNVYKKIFTRLKEVKKGPMFLAFEIGPGLEKMLLKEMKENLENYHFEIIDDNLSLPRYLFIELE